MPDSWGAPQVGKRHYFTEEYLSDSRFLGLREQVAVCLCNADNSSFLEIGPGPGLLTALLRHFGRKVVTVDFAADLAPDVVGRLPDLPFNPGSFDVVCAFEVLEHIPFDLLGRSLAQMGRIARRRVIVSVPDQRCIHKSVFAVSVTVGRRKYRKTLYKRPLGALTNPAEHFWELGAAGMTAQHVIDAAAGARLNLVREQFTEPWFHTFVFTPAAVAG